jgi:hypothetical protein
VTVEASVEGQYMRGSTSIIADFGRNKSRFDSIFGWLEVSPGEQPTMKVHVYG